MGCIQSYFRRATAGSSQASPTDVDKPFTEFERKHEENVNNNVPIVSEEDLSPLDDPNSENVERGSLHYAEATAVSTLAANTSSVAILGTTANCNQNIEYRRSLHEQSINVDVKSEKKQEDSQSAPGAYSELDERIITEEKVEKSQLTQNGPTSIITTAIIETRPTEGESSTKIIHETEIDTDKSENFLPKVVQSIEKTKKDSIEKKEDLRNQHETTINEIESESTSKISPSNEKQISIEREEKSDKISLENGLETDTDKTNESEIESTSSEIISVVNDPREDIVQKNSTVEESTRPNRLSLGQMSIEESEQNTLEISSADDVMKNESTDLTSPESLRESFDESFTKMNLLESRTQSKDDGETSSKDENAREISNTSLNTLGDDSEDGSDLEGLSRKTEPCGIRRFDTISSNGESSYNRVEDQNYPSVTEEPDLEENVDQKLMELDLNKEDNVFDNEDLIRLQETVRETVSIEVDRICKKAVEKTNDIMAKMAAEAAGSEPKDNEEVNNVSESSVLSIVDSVAAEKGSDFDSLSFLDEQSESRSVSGMGLEDSKSIKAENEDVSVTVISPADEAQKRLQEWEQVPTSVQEDHSQNISGAVITQEDISIGSEKPSEDLPKPPDLEEFPPLPENLDQFDITEDELKAVQLPESINTVTKDPAADQAASKIQAGVRGYLTRKQIKENYPNSESALQSNPDGLKDYNIQKKRMSLDSKLGDFENIRKLPKLRCTLSECVEEDSENLDLDKAASKIQATFRNYRARKSICMGDSKKILNGQLTQKKIVEENSEKETDKVDNTKAPTPDNTSNEEDQKPSETQTSTDQMGSNRMAVKTFDDDPLKQAAVKIQATYRGFKTRKSIQISASAATKIQAHFRGYKVRKSIKRSSSLNDLRTSASSSCSNIEGQQDLERRVTKIQAGVRGYLVRKRHSLQNSAAAKIQINYRKYKSRKEQNRPSEQ